MNNPMFIPQLLAELLENQGGMITLMRGALQYRSRALNESGYSFFTYYHDGTARGLRAAISRAHAGEPPERKGLKP